MVGVSTWRVPQNVTDRFPTDGSLFSGAGDWWVAYVKPRHEKALAKELVRFSVPFYLPLICRVHRRPDNGKPRKAVVPLFPCYVPFRGEEHRRLLYDTGRVRKILRVIAQDSFVRELRGVDAVLKHGEDARVCSTLPVGSLVRVARGPLKDLQGYLEQVEGQEYLVLGVEMFHRYIMVRVNPDHVVCLDSGRSAARMNSMS